jgi:hypothetical protein
MTRLGYLQTVQPTTSTGWTTYDGPGRLFLPAQTNYCTNPSMEAYVGGAATGYNNNGTATGDVWSIVSGRAGGVAQRVTYTAAGGVSGATFTIQQTAQTADSSFAAGDKVTLSFFYKSSIVGETTTYPVLLYYTNTPTFVSSENGSALPDTTEWTRYSYVFTVPATATKIRAQVVLVTGLDATDTIDITIDDVQVEKSAVLTPYFDGSSTGGGCAWTGAANASTSTRAVSVLEYANPFAAGAIEAAGTLAARVTSLWAGNDSAEHILLSVNDADASEAWLLEKASANYWDGMGRQASAATAITSAGISHAAGTTHAVIASHVAGSTQDLVTDGVAAAQKVALVKTPGTVTAVRVGSWFTGGIHGISYIGSCVVSPSDIGATNRLALSTGLTAGRTGADLVRFFRDRGYANTLVIPLASDGTAYKLVG